MCHSGFLPNGSTWRTVVGTCRRTAITDGRCYPNASRRPLPEDAVPQRPPPTDGYADTSKICLGYLSQLRWITAIPGTGGFQMATITNDELARILKDAGLEDAAQGVVFPWGVTMIEIDGAKILRPMTPLEYSSVVKRETGRDLTDEEISSPSCSWTSSGCVSEGCRQAGGWCRMDYDHVGHSWYCICEH